jgi:hypothetical protein
VYEEVEMEFRALEGIPVRQEQEVTWPRGMPQARGIQIPTFEKIAEILAQVWTIYILIYNMHANKSLTITTSGPRLRRFPRGWALHRCGAASRYDNAKPRNP